MSGLRGNGQGGNGDSGMSDSVSSDSVTRQDPCEVLDDCLYLLGRFFGVSAEEIGQRSGRGVRKPNQFRVSGNRGQVFDDVVQVIIETENSMQETGAAGERTTVLQYMAELSGCRLVPIPKVEISGENLPGEFAKLTSGLGKTFQVVNESLEDGVISKDEILKIRAQVNGQISHLQQVLDMMVHKANVDAGVIVEVEPQSAQSGTEGVDDA